MIDRLARLRDVMETHGAGAALISHPTNRRYFSGFPDGDHAPDESSGVLLVTGENATLYVSPTNLPWARNSVRERVSAEPWQRPWQTFIGERLRGLGPLTVLFEDRALTVSDYGRIRETASEATFVPAGNDVHLIRAIKDADEIRAIAEAARITDAALAAATAELQPGVSEKALVWRIADAMRLHGAEPGFGTIVAAGPHGARPHHDPSERPIAAGEPIVIDMGAQVDGYVADLTRTICVGEPVPEFADRYNTLLAVQQTALKEIRPGMTGEEADAIAREALIAVGFEDALIHGLGHGVGLNVHEFPSLGVGSEDVLEPGQVVTVEPGIYFEGWGGIRIEDLCVVTDDGLQILSAAPK